MFGRRWQVQVLAEAEDRARVDDIYRINVRDGIPLLDAATEGARQRFRPVMMTSFAFILGLLPLVVATGDSQLARRNVGTPVFGGNDPRVPCGDFCNPTALCPVPGHAREAEGVGAPP
jgi:multidrug efflux pump subunit AcrB